MAKFDEMSVMARIGIMLLVAVALFVGFYYFVLNDIIQKNKVVEAQIIAKKAENLQLQQYEPRLEEMNKQIALLQGEIEREKKIVPEDKDVDQFIKILHDTASTAGIEIRRYTTIPGANHEFYGEVPFAIDIDGPYYSVLNFFDRVARLERIVNITNMQMSNVKNPGPSRVRGTYAFAPTETVVASCTATTFFSHDQQPETAAPAPPAARK
ncbi:MAG TPA: type 4a pilus biogenesis protein PilO [Verrucomicrobiae bacterium]|jgi:type IV pilus assembly protein PilO|nr:type 4a pilus biogenesis protein PilO [Verrucomicrobiae bacterium]